MLFPLQQDRRFHCAVVGSPALGGPGERLAELSDLYRMAYAYGVEDVFVIGAVLDPAMPASAAATYAARHFPYAPGIRTWHSCSRLAQAMLEAGRRDWVLLPKDGLRLVARDGVEIPVSFVDDPEGRSYDAACRQPPADGAIDHLQLYAAPCREGDAQHLGSYWLLRTGIMSGELGTVGAIRVDLVVDGGRIRDDEYVLEALSF